MSLFTELFTLTQTRRFAMLVSSDHATGLLTVAVMPRAVNEADGPFCKDLTLTATPEEFDAGFVQAISAYRSNLLPLLEQVKEANAAIEKTAQHAKSAANAKAPAKAALPKAPSRADKPAAAQPSVADKARAYREAAEGGEEPGEAPDEDLSNDWMKNRQPELF